MQSNNTSRSGTVGQTTHHSLTYHLLLLLLLLLCFDMSYCRQQARAPSAEQHHSRNGGNESTPNQQEDLLLTHCCCWLLSVLPSAGSRCVTPSSTIGQATAHSLLLLACLVCFCSAGSRRVHPQQSNNTSRGGADESSNQQEQDLSRKSNSLSRNSTQSEHTNTNTARASNAGGKTEKRVSEISVYTENALDPEALKSGSKSRKRWLCLLLPLLLLLSATGVFVGLYVTKQLQPKAAAAGGGPLTFQVTVAAPARTASESCDIWFGSSEVSLLYSTAPAVVCTLACMPVCMLMCIVHG
jgi:hypothetical protein